MSFGHERLDDYRAATKTRSEYTAVRIDPDSDSDSDPERQKGRIWGSDGMNPYTYTAKRYAYTTGQR